MNPSRCTPAQPTPRIIAQRIRHVNARVRDLEPRPVVPSYAIAHPKSRCNPQDSDNPSSRPISSGSWTESPLPTSIRSGGTQPFELRQKWRRICNSRVPYVLCPRLISWTCDSEKSEIEQFNSQPRPQNGSKIGWTSSGRIRYPSCSRGRWIVYILEPQGRSTAAEGFIQILRHALS